MTSTFRLVIAYSAHEGADKRGAEQANRLPSKRREDRCTHDGAAPVPFMPPASLFTFRDRQRDRLYGAVENVWQRDQGAHRAEITALLALVDAGQMTIAKALELVTDLDRRTQPQLRAA